MITSSRRIRQCRLQQMIREHDFKHFCDFLDYLFDNDLLVDYEYVCDNLDFFIYYIESREYR